MTENAPDSTATAEPTQQTLPNTETPTAPANGENAPETKETKPDPQAAKLAELEKANAELAAYKEKAETEKLSEQEKIAKREKDAADKVAKLEREAAFLEAGLPKALAHDLSPKAVAAHIEKVTGDKVKEALALKGVGSPIKPTADGAGKTPAKNEPDSSRRVDRKDPYVQAVTGKGSRKD